jgi:hypothetical protein
MEHVTVLMKLLACFDDSLQQLEFHGHYSQYRWKILSSPCTVCLLTLTSGTVS